MAGRKSDKSILSEDGTVKFDFMTSLQNIVMAKIVSHFWMNKSSLQGIVNFIHSGIRPGRREKSDSWQQVKNNIVAKISELHLPNSMREKINNIVPVLGNSILNWIRYHECILNTNAYSAVDYINNIAWTPRGKIDYAQTTKNILADKDSGLCDDHKYKLACVNCLQDEIAVLAPIVVNQYYLHSVQIHMHPMVYFWTTHITGDDTELYNHYREYIKLKISINGYIMQLLINSNKHSYKTFNEVPIRYMWGKLSVEEKAKNVTSLVKELNNQELIYTLLSSLDFDKQQEVFMECSDTILFGIFNDWLWEEYFLPIAVHILDIMETPAYLSILNHVQKEISKISKEENKYLYNKYSYIFKQLWQEGCSIFKHENAHSLVRIILSLSWERDMDLIELMFNNLNEEQKKSIIFDYRGIRRCVNLIKDDKWDLLEHFIKFVLSAEEDINKLKERILNDWWYEISEHFLMYQAFDKIEHFMSWASKSKEKIDGIRKSLAYRKCKAALESVIPNNKIDFTDLENHLKWCANGDLDVINQFKAEIAKSYSEELIRKLIENDKYELLDLFLKWCFVGKQESIVQFKSNMYKNDNLMAFFGSITEFLIRKDNTFKRLDIFVNWLFTNNQEVQAFKRWLLYPLEKSCSLCTSFLVENEFELADKFSEWCVTSAEEISQFKKILMLSKDFTVIFRIHYNHKKTHLPFLIKWLNPSGEVVETFRNIYPVEKCPNGFYKLLDDFLEKRNSFLESNEESAKEIRNNSVFENSHFENIQEK